ncbi:MAG: DUF6746 family protein [Alphaproteobacteria bacterium]
MHKIISLAAAIAFGTLSITAAFAEKEERVEHYAAKEIASKEEALKLLVEDRDKIEKLMAPETLNTTHMEAVHEITYTLEACVEMLMKEKTTSKTALEDLDEAVQALHYASEKHSEAETREWFKAFNTALTKIN